MFWNYVIAFILSGSAVQSDVPGRVGFTWSMGTHVVIRVYKDSPAALAGIHKGDKVISNLPPGPAGEAIDITVLRKGEKLTFNVVRTAWNQVSKQAVDSI